jgi:hypothetical protein
MENIKSKIEQAAKRIEQEKSMEEFYKKYFEVREEGVRTITLDNLKELKGRGVTTEQFLNYICQGHGFLLHGSINEVGDDKLKSQNKKIFASNKSAIAIMRSIYSNIDVNLKYPYFIDENNPLKLEIHTRPDGKFISADKGYIYVVDAGDFRNDPEGSWQFVNEKFEVPFRVVIETEKADFKYPVKVIK